jgi:hypothetical protein
MPDIEKNKSIIRYTLLKLRELSGVTLSAAELSESQAILGETGMSHADIIAAANLLLVEESEAGE